MKGVDEHILEANNGGDLVERMNQTLRQTNTTEWRDGRISQVGLKPVHNFLAANTGSTACRALDMAAGKYLLPQDYGRLNSYL